MAAGAAMEALTQAGALAGWNYGSAFQRNLGLISEEEQRKLRNCRVAIAGMGGVGGGAPGNAGSAGCRKIHHRGPRHIRCFEFQSPARCQHVEPWEKQGESDG